jgi:hypothetical protein
VRLRPLVVERLDDLFSPVVLRRFPLSHGACSEPPSAAEPS